VTATGAEAGSNLVPAAPASPTAADTVRATEAGQAESTPGERADDIGHRSRRTLLRAVGAVVLAVLAAAVAWLLLRHGIRTDAFPPFLSGAPSTPITRYSGPWITAAAGVALLAALLLLLASIDVIRWSRPGSRSTG